MKLTFGPTAYYRKRPVVVKAFQTYMPLDIMTLEGAVRASAGDFIITGIAGEQYPCKPDIFTATYEPVEPVDEKEHTTNG